jgi:hypothetical protein
VTETPQEHARYDELAAGYALHALDPEAELQFRSHLPTCPRCEAALSDFTEVAAALADDWSTVEPSPQLGARIRAAIAQEPANSAAQAPQQAPAAPAARQANVGQDRRQADASRADASRADASRADASRADSPRDSQFRDASPGDAGHADRFHDRSPRENRSHGEGGAVLPAGVTDLAQHRRRRRRLTTLVGSAAAAVLVAGGAIWGGLAASGNAPSPPTSSCVRAGACREVQLTDARSHAPAAKVVIADGTAWLIPSGLPADNRVRQVYVLWQITGAHTPLAVGSFDVSGRGSKPVKIGQLAAPYRGTWAFAVSIERGRTIPATPSHPVALGQVPS